MIELGGRFLIRMLEYTVKSVEYNNKGDMYQRLLISSILAINPIDNATTKYIESLINTARIRVLDDDLYNARLLISTAIRCMEESKYVG